MSTSASPRRRPSSRRSRRSRRSERGAAALLFALLSVVLLGFAALGVDIAQQVTSKQLLVNQLDAAATAGASQLGNGGGTAGAVTAATTFYAQNGNDQLDPRGVDFWCVVARKLNGDNTPFVPAMVADLQIPTTTRSGGVCNPDATSTTTTWRQQDYQHQRRTWDNRELAMTCSATLCAVPCALRASPTNGWAAGTSIANNRPITCNTIRVGAERLVPFSFAPVLGIDEGSTGSQISVACAGSCGAVSPNPMDVAIVADRTLSMTEPLGCTIYGTTPCRDYRQDLVTGIKGMLQVMTPEQQYVALGTIGPSNLTRSTAETKACNQQGLVYPSALGTTVSSGSWVPIAFKKDYLGAPDVNGKRAANPNSLLVKAVDCLDDVDQTREQRLVNTRTALAAPLKAAARYLLNKSGDQNNVAALENGVKRTGDVKKVIIFETDGEPYENEPTSTGSVTLENGNEIFSRYTDYTSTATTSGPTLSDPPQNGTPANVSPAPASPYNQSSQYPASYTSSNRTYTNTYKVRTNTTTTTNTRTYGGGQKACQNFRQVADLAKQAGVLVITIGYDLGDARCSDSNDVASAPAPTTSTGTPWISDIQPTACRSGGNGTQASPYTQRTACAQNTTITYTVPQSRTVTTTVQGAGDARVTDVLAAASGGGDTATGATGGCSSADQIAEENSDEDLMFCAARGDELAPLFVTALSRVTAGSKLIRLP